MSGKGPHVRRFLYNLVHWLAGAMTRARLDADEMRHGSDIRRPKCSDIFKAVPRHYTIVRVGAGRKDRGVGLAGFDVVVGG